MGILNITLQVPVSHLHSGLISATSFKSAPECVILKKVLIEMEWTALLEICCYILIDLDSFGEYLEVHAMMKLVLFCHMHEFAQFSLK